MCVWGGAQGQLNQQGFTLTVEVEIEEGSWWEKVDDLLGLSLEGLSCTFASWLMEEQIMSENKSSFELFCFDVLS